MGYYVNIEDVDFLIPPHNLERAFELLKALNHPSNNHLKRGGSFGGGGKTAYWYSWMSEDYDKTTQSAEEIFKMLGFDTSVTEEGLRLLGYDSKTGQEDLFLDTVASLVRQGSYIVWRGEDGDTWKQIFNGTGVVTQQGRVTFQ